MYGLIPYGRGASVGPGVGVGVGDGVGPSVGSGPGFLSLVRTMGKTMIKIKATRTKAPMIPHLIYFFLRSLI